MLAAVASVATHARVLLALCALAIVASVARPAAAQSIRIKVRGTAKITARAARDQGELVLSGALVDDAGEPLAGQTVTIHVAREGEPNDPKVAEGLRAARACDRATERAPLAYAVRVAGPPTSPDVVVVTDEGGRFCFRSRPPLVDRYRAHLAWRGSSLVDAADADLAFDPTRQALLLRFDPTPRSISLDEPRATFEATAIVDDDATTHVARDLVLALANERGEEIAQARTDAAGRARFAVPSSRLGAPGPGEVRVSFAGNNDIAFATHVAEIERHAKVSLRVPAIERGDQKAANPEDGIPLLVDVTSAAGPVSEGGVEARVGDTVVGAAPVERGIARLTLTFAASTGEAAVHLRYVPTAPWYEPLGDTVVRVPVRGPGLLAKAPILVAGAAVLLFFLFGRVSARQAKPEPAKAPADAAAREGKPRLDVLRPAASGERGWRGRVVDAHDGAPIAGARLWIERGTFDGRALLASVASDARGEFTLPAIDAGGGDERMGVEAPLHARLVQPLPPPGELAIALVMRKRALLARLVAWAKRAGGAYDARPEPTPGHVRRAASEEPHTARWAEAVEEAVFGGGDVDAQREQEIDRMAPEPSRAEPPPDPVVREKQRVQRPEPRKD